MTDARKKVAGTVFGMSVFVDDRIAKDEIVVVTPVLPQQFPNGVVEFVGSGTGRFRMMTREEFARKFP